MKLKAYKPESGYQYQLFTRNAAYSREWEHLDYATNAAEKRYLLTEYRLAYGVGWEFRSLILPRRYWPRFQPA